MRSISSSPLPAATNSTPGGVAAPTAITGGDGSWYALFPSLRSRYPPTSHPAALPPRWCCRPGGVAAPATTKEKRIAHHYELGYLLQQNQWNKGIMTTALQKFISILPSKITIHAECKQSNYRSQRVLVKCGFTYDKDDLWQRIIK